MGTSSHEPQAEGKVVGDLPLRMQMMPGMVITAITLTTQDRQCDSNASLGFATWLVSDDLPPPSILIASICSAVMDSDAFLLSINFRRRSATLEQATV